MRNSELDRFGLFQEDQIPELKRNIYWQSFLAPLTEKVLEGSHQRAWDKRTHAEYRRIQAI